MQAHCHQFVGGFPVTLGNRYRGFVVQAQHHLRFFIAEVIDQAVVQSAVTCAGIQRDVFHVERAQRAGDHVAAKHGVAGRGGCRGFVFDGGAVVLLGHDISD